MVNATPEDLSHCPGLGDVKVRRLLEAFTTPFRGGPPPSAQKGTQRALDEMGIGTGGEPAAAARVMGKGRAVREPSPDWPSDGEDEDGAFPAAQDVGRAQKVAPVAREPSPDWPSDDEVMEVDATGDEVMIDVDDILAEGAAAAAAAGGLKRPSE